MPSDSRFRKLLAILVISGGTFTASAWAQAEAGHVGAILGGPILPLGRIAKPPMASGATAWTAENARIRAHLLKDVVFHGWPPAWVEAQPKFGEAGAEKLDGKMPAILNVNGRVGAPRKAVEYKQKRCINFARHGILALNLDWFSWGELATAGNEYWYGGHLDLTGAHDPGLFSTVVYRPSPGSEP